MIARKKMQISQVSNDILSWNKNFPQNIQKDKWQKMAVSPFTFFRGTNHLFWNYFANDKRILTFSNPELFTWIQGDLHSYNYGIFSNDKGEIIYDLNDFDEAFISDYQWDLWRMAASIVIIGRENTFKKVQEEKFIASFLNSYLEVMYNYVENKKIPNSLNGKTSYGKLDEILQQSFQNNSREKMVKEWTSTVKGERKFDLKHKKIQAISEEHKKELKRIITNYGKKISAKHTFPEGYFKILDIAERISTGIGSYGNPRYYVLIRGKENKPEAHIILDVKFQTIASGMVFSSKKFPLKFKNHAQRHELAYVAFNQEADNHLSSLKLPEGYFSVRERSPYKSYFPTQLLNTETRFRKLAEQWGSTLAAAHLRASKKIFKGSLFTKALKGKEESFIHLVQNIAFEYSDFNVNAYNQLINTFYLDS